MGVMARTALTTAERLMSVKSAHLHSGLLMAVKTEGFLGLGQQLLHCGLVGSMAVSATPLLGRGMDLRTVGIALLVMAGIAERRGRLSEQRLPC